MKINYGKHFLADLYLCQEKIWGTSSYLQESLEKVVEASHSCAIRWVTRKTSVNRNMVIGENDELLIILQIIPEKNFLALDVFSWQTERDFQALCDGIIEAFAPQVIAEECRLRGEHLMR